MGGGNEETVVAEGGVDDGGQDDSASVGVDVGVRGKVVVVGVVCNLEAKGDGLVVAGIGGVVVGTGDEGDIVVVDHIGGGGIDEDDGIGGAVIFLDQLDYTALIGEFQGVDVGGVDVGAGVNYIVVAALRTIEVGVDIDGFVVADVGVGEGGSGTVVDGVAGDHSEELASGGDVADDGAVIDFVALDDDHGSIDLEGGDVGCENDAGRGNVIVNVVAAVKGVADNDVLFVTDVGVFIVGNGSGGDAFAIDDAGEGANGGDEVGGIGATSVDFGGVDNGTSNGQLFGCDGCKEGVVLRSDIVDGVRAAKGVGDDNGFDAADTGS